MYCTIGCYNCTLVDAVFLGLFNSMLFELPIYALYTIVRGFLYASYGAFIGVAFPANHFATLIGLGKFCGALWSLLLEYTDFLISTMFTAGLHNFQSYRLHK